MTDQHEETLDLGEVRERFIATSEALERITESASHLESESAQLASASTSVTDAASSVREMSSTLQGLAQELAEAAQTMRQTDPAAVRSELQSLSDRITQLGESSGQRAAEQDESAKGLHSETLDHLAVVGASVSRLRLAVILIALLATVAAVFSGLAAFA